MDNQYPVSPETKAAVVAMPDEIDIANAGRLAADLDSACRSDADIVIADMTQTTFCDASGVRMLVLAQRRAAECGAELLVAVSSPRVRRVLTLLGLDQIVPLHATVDAARRAGQRQNRAPRAG
jgi:anti-sigma B factor antagonist